MYTSFYLKTCSYRMVYLKSYSRSVVNLFCVLSQSLFCLFVLIYTVSQKVLKVHFRRRSSKVVFSTGSTMELVVCLSLLKSSKIGSFWKYKIHLPWTLYSVEELLYSSAVFWITQTLYCLQGYLLSKAHNLLLSLWISSRSKISVRTENNSLKEAHTLKGLLIELNCHWCTVQLVRPVTILRATTGTSPAIWARGWGVLWSGPVGDFRG